MDVERGGWEALAMGVERGAGGFSMGVKRGWEALAWA